MPDHTPPFADPKDLQDRWFGMPEDLDNTRLLVVLGDVSQFLLDIYPQGVARSSDQTLKRVVCSVARRALEAPAELIGMESATETAGQVSLSLRPTNPHGDFYLTSMERKALLGPQRAWSVDLLGGA